MSSAHLAPCVPITISLTSSPGLDLDPWGYRCAVLDPRCSYLREHQGSRRGLGVRSHLSRPGGKAPLSVPGRQPPTGTTNQPLHHLISPLRRKCAQGTDTVLHLETVSFLNKSSCEQHPNHRCLLPLTVRAFARIIT